MKKYYNQRQLYWNNKWCYLLSDDDKTAWIVKGYIGRKRRYRVPEYVEFNGVRYTIVSIEIGAFRLAKCLKHLVIPDSIEYIDEYNFSSLPSLRSIYIGKGLKYVSSWIFHSNKRLRSFVIDKDNPYFYVNNGIVYTKDGKCAITTPFAMKCVNIKEGTEIVKDIAFWCNENLRKVILPSSTKTIGKESFAECPNLKNIIAPERFVQIIKEQIIDKEHYEFKEKDESAK